ncbi:membrane hypothetical protein [uncultured Gammaproteobacteria bacterium]
MLGTDALGRDVLSRALYGLRPALLVAIGATLIAALAGGLLGGWAGWRGGGADALVGSLIGFAELVPEAAVWLVLAALAPVAQAPVTQICLILAAGGWMAAARAAQRRAQTVRWQPYVAMARLNGLPGWRALTRHGLPELVRAVVPVAVATLPRLMLGETLLSLLGLGLPSALPSWGVQMYEAGGAAAMAAAPWLMVPLVPVLVVPALLMIAAGSVADD